MPKILAVPTQVFKPFRGVDTDPKSMSLLIHARLVERGPAETNPRLKQLIPYTVIVGKNGMFNYLRGKAGAEARLHAKRSIGVGGHIDAEDCDTDGHVGLDVAEKAILTAMCREVEEEVGLKANPWEFDRIGLLNEDDTEVGKVHLGILYVLRVDNNVVSHEPCLLDAKFSPFQSIDPDGYELWSQIAIDHFRKCGEIATLDGQVSGFC